MELQSMANGWDNLGGLYGMYWNWFGTKRMGGLWFGNQNAEAALFCKKMVFLCFGRLRGWIARASDSRQYAKVVWNAYKLCSYQISKIWIFCKFTWFWSKSVKWYKTGLYRLSSSMHKIVVPLPKFMKLVCCKERGPRFKGSKLT